MKILLCDYHISDHGESEKSYFSKYLPNAEFEAYEYVDEEGLLKRVKDVDVIMTCFLQISRNVIEAATNLKMISVDATGYGNIDIEACKERGVLVATLGDYCTEEVADHTLSLILALEKNLKAYDKSIVESGRYDFKIVPYRKKLAEQELAIIGYGRIGKAVAKRAKAFGFNVLAVTRHPEMLGKKDEFVTYVSLEEALENADVISNHMSQTGENENYFDLFKFQKMKKHPIFINVSRGACVDEKALIYALNTGLISAAGLDVLKDTHPEKKIIDSITNDHVILTPHSAFYSKEVMEFLSVASVSNVVYFCTNQRDKITNII